ncbi:MAG: orotate phosphoribosyltransferase [Gemmatimonadetes bacterium]|nr:orotate phosphoribosyltransferase [Gemmatimonadota bacterium]
MTSRERLRRLLAERSFRTGSFKLSSGKTSDFYIDCRATTMHAEGLHLIGEVGLDALDRKGWRPDLVGGLTMGADPIAYAIASASWRRGRPIHAFSMRKHLKRHGTGRRIEGCYEPGARVVVVEDVITSGGSALQVCRAVREEGGEVLGVLALVDRQEGGSEAIGDAGIPMTSLYTGNDLRAASPA